jgi:hypothetical protein
MDVRVAVQTIIFRPSNTIHWPASMSVLWWDLPFVGAWCSLRDLALLAGASHKSADVARVWWEWRLRAWSLERGEPALTWEHWQGLPAACSMVATFLVRTGEVERMVSMGTLTWSDFHHLCTLDRPRLHTLFLSPSILNTAAATSTFVERLAGNPGDPATLVLFGWAGFLSENTPLARLLFWARPRILSILLNPRSFLCPPIDLASLTTMATRWSEASAGFYAFRCDWVPRLVATGLASLEQLHALAGDNWVEERVGVVDGSIERWLRDDVLDWDDIVTTPLPLLRAIANCPGIPPAALVGAADWSSMIAGLLALWIYTDGQPWEILPQEWQHFPRRYATFALSLETLQEFLQDLSAEEFLSQWVVRCVEVRGEAVWDVDLLALAQYAQVRAWSQVRLVGGVWAEHVRRGHLQLFRALFCDREFPGPVRSRAHTKLIRRRFFRALRCGSLSMQVLTDCPTFDCWTLLAWFDHSPPHEDNLHAQLCLWWHHQGGTPETVLGLVAAGFTHGVAFAVDILATDCVRAIICGDYTWDAIAVMPQRLRLRRFPKGGVRWWHRALDTARSLGRPRHSRCTPAHTIQ